MAGRLTGRRAVVTGGAAGIGKAIAAAYLREEASVVIADIDAEIAQGTAEELSEFGTIFAIGCDVTSLAETRSMAAEAIDRLGGVNVLVNNAGLSGRGLITEIPEERIDALLVVNLKGVILCAQAFAQAMYDTGNAVMINMSSQAGKRGWPELSVYGATKAGVLGMNWALSFGCHLPKPSRGTYPTATVYASTTNGARSKQRPMLPTAFLPMLSG